MKVNKTSASNSFFAPRFFAHEILLLCCVFLPVDLPAQNQIESGNQRRKQIENNSRERRRMFWKTSSTNPPADEGNRIVAIRRINLIFDDVDSKGSTFKNKKLLYEVELFSSVKIPATNSTQYLIIGDIVFREPLVTGDRQSIYAYLTKKEFKALKDGALVHYMISPAPINSENIKKAYKNGEPKQIPGAKFGRIQKRAAARTPIIEENGKTQLLRITKTKKSLQAGLFFTAFGSLLENSATETSSAWFGVRVS